MTDRPHVSVIVPVWNGRKFLAEALASIAEQDFRDFEVVVVDDGSTDGSGELARPAATTFIAHESSRGVAASRNEAIRASRGTLLAFLDQDDVWAPGALTAHVTALARDPECVSILLGVQFVEEGKPVPEWFRRRELLEHPHPSMVPSGMAFRRATFERIGPFDEELLQASDFDWLARARGHGIRVAVSDEVLLRRRLHEENESRKESAKEELYRTIRANLRRRREGGTR